MHLLAAPLLPTNTRAPRGHADEPGHVPTFQERSCLCSLPWALWGKTWLVANFHNEEGHCGFVYWSSTEDTELDPFILGAAQTWGERTDFALMYKTEDKKLM